MTVFELIVSVFVIALVLYAVWKVGQQNPVSTGRLSQRISAVESQIGAFDGRLESVEVAVVKLADAAKSTSNTLEAISVEQIADRKVNDKTWEAVDRIQKWFMEEGFKAMIR